MSESVRMWVEILFNLAYLIVIWGLVFAMLRRRAFLTPNVRPYATLFPWAFGLLTTIQLLDVQLGLVGLGALSTAVTVTFFYVFMLLIWQRRFNTPLGRLGILLMTAAAVRLIVMVFPQNQWNNSVPPWNWSMIRNVPLMIQGLGVAYLILRDAGEAQDRILQWMGIMVLVSFGFYTPVILFVQQAPMLGMLMIPKTMAYVAIAWLAYTHLFPRSSYVPAPA
jgi:hypothetical protein